MFLVKQSSARSRFPPTVNIPTQQSEESSEDDTYSDKGSIDSNHYSIDLQKESESEQESLQDLTEKVSRLSFSGSKQKMQSNSAFSLKTSSPFMMYEYVEENQRMIVVDFLVKTMSEDDFRLRLSKCGNKLYIQTALPDFFVQHNRLVRAEHNNSSFNVNSSKAVAYKQLIDDIEKEVKDDLSGVIFAPPPSCKFVLHLQSKQRN